MGCSSTLTHGNTALHPLQLLSHLLRDPAVLTLPVLWDGLGLCCRGQDGVTHRVQKPAARGMGGLASPQRVNYSGNTLLNGVQITQYYAIIYVLKYYAIIYVLINHKLSLNYSTY